MPLAALVRVAGRRWTILAMLAYAYLAVLATTERARQCPPEGLIPLSCNEIHRLFNTLAARPSSDVAHHLSWSTWRR